MGRFGGLVADLRYRSVEAVDLLFLEAFKCALFDFVEFLSFI